MLGFRFPTGTLSLLMARGGRDATGSLLDSWDRKTEQVLGETERHLFKLLLSYGFLIGSGTAHPEESLW